MDRLELQARFLKHMKETNKPVMCVYENPVRMTVEAFLLWLQEEDLEIVRKN